MASFVILLTARTARIACSDRHTYRQTHTHTHTHTRDNYCNPLCADAPMVNDGNSNKLIIIIIILLYSKVPVKWVKVIHGLTRKGIYRFSA